jgi:Zn-dependent peptidase ImmA (M78 family)
MYEMEKARVGYARQMARKVLGDAKISGLPVDLKIILEKKGYEYIEVDTFLDSVDALILKSDGIYYAAVNAKHHPHRQRFSLAHEFGHILLNHNPSYYNPGISLDNPPASKNHTSTEAMFETEANSFAGELLVPLEMLKKEFKKTTDIGELSKMFYVSTAVMSIAISNNLQQLYK